MWYIFDNSNKCVATANNRPNFDDLATRGERAVEYDSTLTLSLDDVQNRLTIVNGSLVYTAPAAPTAEEIKIQNIAALEAEYQSQFASLAQSLGLATLDGEQDVIDSIKLDYTALKIEYQKKKEGIENGK